MSRWIDADALMEKLKQHHDFFVKAWGSFKEMPLSDKARCDELSNSMAEVFNAPSVDICFCKDCKHYQQTQKGKPFEYHRRYCNRGATKATEPNDFCSYGVRKTNTTAEEKPTPIRDYMVHGEREGE